jgi:WD40 repeat protein
MPRKEGPPPFFEVWDLAAGKVVFTLKPKDKQRFWDGVLSPDGDALVVAEQVGGLNFEGGGRYRIGWWDCASGKLTRERAGLTGPVALSPDGKVLAATRFDKGVFRVLLVDARRGEILRELAQPTLRGRTTELGWSPAELHFAPGGKALAGRGIQRHDWVVWDTSNGTLIAGTEPAPPWNALALAADGKTVAVASEAAGPRPTGPGLMRFSRVSLQPLGVRSPSVSLPRMDGLIEAVAFSPDGKLLAVGADSALRVWRVPGQESLLP